MKKLIPILLALVLLAGCSGKGNGNVAPSGATMPEMIDQICKDIDVPKYETTELTKENFEYYTAISYADGLTGYHADALISSIPHSLVLVRSENGDTADIAQKMLDNADLRKWICVAAEVKQTAFTEHYVVLVMSTAEIAKKVIANFGTAANDGTATALAAVGAATSGDTASST